MQPHDRDHEQHGEPKPDRHPTHRGVQHLRVGIELGPSGARITSMWLVDQPAVQHLQPVGPIFSRVDLGTAAVLVEGFADPRASRGLYREKLGHHFGMAKSGIVYVSVPFTDVRDLADVRVRVLDASKASLHADDPKTVAALFDRPEGSAAVVADLSASALRSHADWPKVAGALGLPVANGRFEIYAAREGGFRWRLRRSTGDVVAESAAAHPTRQACEDEINWLRAHAAEAAVASTDSVARGGGCG